MARSCGIRLGPRRYEVVVLDGSPKKHKIVAFEAGEIDANLDGDIQASTAKLKDAAKRLGVPKESVGLVIDSGHAAFRRLSLPFSDQTKIGQVVKYEVESELPQWNVEDVIVDWHTLAASDATSDLLITAVPKDYIQAALDLTSSAGIEPFEVELETSAMVNAAFAAELCNLDDAQLLVHIGDHSTSVVVMDAGDVREMRVIHIGALTHDAVPQPEPTSEDGEGTPAEEPQVDPAEAGRRVDQAIKRIRRELGRTISGARTINPIDAVYVCGMELPGLIGSAVLDVPVHVLDCFEEDSGQPADGFGQLVVAYGAAVRELGGGLMSPSLRREELRFTGTWERIEFPLAVACLLLTTLLGVIFILQKRELHYLESNGASYWLESSNNFLLGTPKRNSRGHMDPPPKEIIAFSESLSDPESPASMMGSVAALARIKTMVEEEIVQLQRQLGQDSAISQPQSALVGSHLVLQVLEAQHEQWRPSIWKLIAETQPAKQNKSPESVKVTLNLVFHADSVAKGVRNYEAFLAACTKVPGFLEAPMKNTNSLDNNKGVEVAGQTITVNVQTYYDQLVQEANSAMGNS